MGKLMDAVKKCDVAAVKQLVADGQDPNKPMKMHGSQTNPYVYALMVSVWCGEVSEELLEIVEFLTPHMNGFYFKDLDGYEFNGNKFYSSYFEEFIMLSKNNEYDVTVEAMLRGGYEFDKDPNFGRYIGNVAFPLARKLVDKFGMEDSSAVCSAVLASNYELATYLLDRGLSPNQPIYSSTGSQTLPLVVAVLRGDEDMVKKLLAAGADPKMKDTGYNMDAFEMAESNENQPILELLKAA